jgi:hypothetical protein
MDFDPEKVNVAYTSSAQTQTTIPRIPAGGTCTKDMSWRYDNPTAPAHVVLCPSSCTTINNDSQARIDIQFGCKTVVMLK